MISKAKLFSVLLLLLSAVCMTHAQEKTTLDGGATAAADPSLRAAQAEMVRRQELVFASMQSLSEAEKLLGSDDLDKALERFEFALKNLPDGDQGKIAKTRAVKGLSQVKARMAMKALEQGKRTEALALAKEALALSENPQTLATLKNVQEEIRRFEKSRTNPEGTENNPVLTQDFKDKLESVSKLFLEGENYFVTGQYDAAIKRYEQILALDPYNKAARLKLARVERYRDQSYHKGREQARNEALYQVKARWSENVPLETAGTKQNEDQAAPSNLGKMTKKLQSIIVPTLQFNEVAIEDAVRFLADKSRELDPEKEGINFVLKKDPTAVPAPATPAGGGAAATPAAIPAPTFAPVTLKLENVSLEQVLNFLTNITPLKYKVEEYAVYLLPLNESSEILQTRTYAVPLGFFKNSGIRAASGGSTSISGAGAGTGPSVESVRTNVLEELKDKGISFVGGATAVYLAGSNKMVMKNTPDQLDVLQALIESQKQEAPQIEIETKFAEFTEDSLKEMAFNWYVNLKTSGGGTAGIPNFSSDSNSGLTNPFTSTAFDPLGFIANFVGGSNYAGDISAATRNRSENDINQNSLDQLLQQNTSSLSGNQPINFLNGSTLQANTPNTFRLGGVIDGRGFMLLANLIDQTKGVDLLSAPKVTTRSNKTAKVEVVREMSFPGDFKKPQFNGTPVVYDNQSITLITPPTPTDFTTQNIGVTMEVTPRAYPDRRIDLELSPEVVDFEGFINYGATAYQGHITNATITPISSYSILKPVFNFRTIKTKIQVVDGQTVAMGGLIREDSQKIKDKVPVLGDIPILGRLFRSEVDKKVKRNLMVFVTARLIRSTGKPAFTQTAMAVPSADEALTSAKPGATR